MDIGNIINEIVNSQSNLHSKELSEWLKETEENQKKYIQYKNTWALLQRGKEIDSKHVKAGFETVKARINHTTRTFNLYNLIRYAAIIVFALVGGYFINSVSQEIALNEISVPSGNRTSVLLPDGSKVWLTNGSKLIYPERFDKKERTVQLQGEAYFTVSHNKKRPFIVNLDKHRIKVLGTEFSAISYPDDNEIRVDLVSGKVQLDVSDDKGGNNFKSYSLQPLHGIVLYKSSGEIKKTKIQDSFFSYWQEGAYKFEDELFESLSKKIERIYGVKIVFEDEIIKKRSFTGVFNIDDNIYTMMEVFKRASGSPFEYKIKRNTIYVKSLN